MGKSECEGSSRGGGKRKNKSRMSYLKQSRRGGGWVSRGGRPNAEEGESSGYKTHDYVSSYGGGGGRGGGRGRGGGGGWSRGRRKVLSAGMKGFLCSTNFREGDCVREAYNLLNEFDEGEGGGEDEPVINTEEEVQVEVAGSEKSEKVDVIEKVEEEDGFQIFSSSKACEIEESKGSVEESSVEVDVAEEMNRELAELKSDRVRKRFHCVETGIKNVVFINSTILDPNEIAYRIFEDVVTKKEGRARYILRFLPISASCHADWESIKKLSKEVLDPYFKDGYKSFKIIANVRHNNRMNKGEMITNLAEAVSEVNQLNFVDLTNPMFTVIGEVLKTVFCIAVVKDFNRFKKFNLIEAAGPTEGTE